MREQESAPRRVSAQQPLASEASARESEAAPSHVQPRASTRRRAYHSPVRLRQAAETRQRIVAAGRALFAELGYAGTTIEAIAARAGVSPKTVVAGFASKRGILAETLNPDVLDSPSQAALERLRAEDDPRARLALVAALTRQVYDASAAELDLLAGGRAIAPELAEISERVEQRRRGKQERLIAFLRRRNALRPDLAPERAVDECWALTSFDIYRMLVMRQGWPPERYESWLADLLAQRLLAA